MIRRSAALRTFAPLLFSLLIVGRIAAAYSDANHVLTIGYIDPPLGSSYYQLNTDGNLVNVVSTATPPPPQLEIIATDRSGHPVNGIPNTYQPKYDEGYGIGYATGYDSGFATGQHRGTSEGTDSGRNDGFNKGFGTTYQPAFDVAYNAQLPIGKAAGWSQGHIDGFAEGYDWAPIIAGSMTVSNRNPYGSGTWGSSSISMSISGGYGLNSNLHFMSPEEVPAFYYKLGLDDGNKDGVSTGSTDGYNVTYPDAYAAAYPVGYQNGTDEGTLRGSTDGKSEGFSAGWELGYGPGFDSGFEAGIQHYLSGHQPSSSYGTLEISLSGQLVPAGPLLGISPVVFLGRLATAAISTRNPACLRRLALSFWV